MAKKTEGGMEFSSSAYLVVPNPDEPSTWKLRVEESPGKVTTAQLGRAAAALGKGFRGNKVQISSGDRSKALAKLKSLYKSQGVGKDELPSVLQQALLTVAIGRFKENGAQLLEALGEKAELKSVVGEDLETFQESLYLYGLSAILNGTVSFETVINAVQDAIEDMHERDQMQQKMTMMNPSMPMEACPYKVVATFPDSFVYADDEGKLWQYSYHMEGTEAILEGDPIEVLFEPTAANPQSSQDNQESSVIIEGFIGQAAITQGKLNRKLNVIEGATLIGPISKNTGNGQKGRRYSEAALKKIAQMAEGLPGYLNHTTPDLAFKPRDVRELAVRHRNVRFDPATQTVKSDMHVMPNHADLVFSLAEQFGDHIGNSVVSKGLVTMEGDTEVVQDIVALRSADLVSDPASTKGLFEGKDSETQPATLIDLIEAVKLRAAKTTTQQEDTMDLAAILAHFKENPDTQKLVLEHLQVIPKVEAAKALATVQESVEVITKERDTLKGEVEKIGKDLQESKVKIQEFEAKESLAAKRVKLAEAISKHKLSSEFGKVKGAVSTEFTALLESMDEDKWQGQLDDRYNALKGVPSGQDPKSRVKDSEVISESSDDVVPPEGSHQRLLRAVSR